MTTLHPDQELNRDELPAGILAYLDGKGDARTAEVFSSDAVVKDNGTIYSTPEQVLSFLTETTSEFDYTTTFQHAHKSDDGRWTVWNRLEGNFPGGVVDLKYVFTLDRSLISRLDITT